MIVLLSGLGGPSLAGAADLEDAEKLFRTGRYEECAKLASEEIGRGFWTEPWDHLKIQADLARGKYEDAAKSLDIALRRFPASIPLRLFARDVYRFVGRENDATAQMDAIEELIQAAPRRYASPEGRLAVGKFFLLRGADARRILDLFYDVVTKERPDYVPAYLATAEMALDKQDYALAAETLRKAPKDAAEDPRYHYLLALALSNDDRAGSAKALAEALKINPRHVDSLLLQADQAIDGDRFEDAAKTVRQALDVNPSEPRAWAYRAVLAHLKNDAAGEEAARTTALKPWPKNPQVDHIIGRKLSQEYRFAEGSAYQKRSLQTDPEYLPAKIQLCQDLLRLGDEDEGWKLAGEIFARDGYNVVAYNLVTLRDRLSGFRALQDEGLIVRMDPREADLYGPRVLALLKKARNTLSAKYGITLNQPVIVEIFPRKQEFAVRTFGLPGAEGFLGVCFGRVVTANSPASQGESPTNWESVLWHEFCHVVTLSKTHNKMPRWLSEGISVYEEGLQDPAWANWMNPEFRKMLLDDALTPLSRLSSAFLAPKTALHLQFAYFESALAVEFLVQSFGLPALKAVLDDLGAGIPTNEALPRRTKMTLDQLDRDFAQFARRKAESVAPEATWEEPDLPPDADSAAIRTWLTNHPKSFRGLIRLGARLTVEEKWQEARDVLERVKTLYPDYVGSENAYMLLAAVHRKTSDPKAERAVLEELAARDGNAGPTYLRLAELAEASGDWKAVAANARRFLGVNPLVPAPYRTLSRASEKLGERDEAIAAYRALAMLDETDPAEVHFRLARLLHDVGKPAEARREVLRSLEEAPRFLDAHRLLLELAGKDRPATPAPSSKPPTVPDVPKPQTRGR